MPQHSQHDTPAPDLPKYRDIGDLNRLLEQSARRGARQALAELGLADDRAADDMRDLRALLLTWRRIRREAAEVLITWGVRLILLLMLGLAALSVISARLME